MSVVISVPADENKSAQNNWGPLGNRIEKRRRGRRGCFW